MTVSNLKTKTAADSRIEATRRSSSLDALLRTGSIAFAVLLWLVLGLILWFVLTPTPIPELVFPAPESVWRAASQLGISLFRHSFFTLARVSAGLVIGIPLGIWTAFAMSRHPALKAALHPVIEFIRPLPATALIPFFIIWFGIGITGQLLLIVLAVFMVLLVETLGAIETVPVVYIRAATAMGARSREIYSAVILPAITPSLVGTVRVAAALAFAVGIAAEFMGAQSGVGYLMMVARRTLNTDTILLGVLIIACESYLLDSFIRKIGSELCRWNESPASLLAANAKQRV